MDNITEFGKVHLIYGYGKGKTSTANGMALRALNSYVNDNNVIRRTNVSYVQFLKDSKSSELQPLKELNKLGYNFNFYADSQEDFIYGEPTTSHYMIAKRNFEKAKELSQNAKVDFLVCDEILCAYIFNLFTLNDIKDLIAEKHKNLELVLTGIVTSDTIFELSDYVTQLNERCNQYEYQFKKHPYITRRLEARFGVEK